MSSNAGSLRGAPLKGTPKDQVRSDRYQTDRTTCLLSKPEIGGAPWRPRSQIFPQPCSTA